MVKDDRPRTSTTVRNAPDPLGYDTSDPEAAIRLMIENALSGRNKEAVEAELAPIRRKFGHAPAVERTDTGQLPDSVDSRVAAASQTSNIGSSKQEEGDER